MSLSRILPRKTSCLLVPRLSQILVFRSDPLLRPISNSNRFLCYALVYKNVMRDRHENRHQNRYQLFVIQSRGFNSRQMFSHNKAVPSPIHYARYWLFLTILIIFVLAFDFQSIWANYIPDYITDEAERKWKQTGRVIKKICGVKRIDGLTIDKVLAEERADSELTAKHQHKSGFRDRKIIEYENRIRMYSNPDKVFRYFASLKIIYEQNESEIYMTPDDFLRALTPGVKQPDGLGLDQFRRIDVSKEEDSELSAMLSQGNKDLSYGLKPDSIFYKLSNYGLINYSDFLFLLTVISVSRRHFLIAFRMFDLNGDGDVEYDEFEKVQNAILSQTSIGKKLGTSRSGYKGVSSALAKYFFGEDLKQKLTTEKFLDFQKQLQSELLTLEFERKKPNPITGKIKETDFADLLIAYAGLTEKRKNKMIKRVKKRFGKDSDEDGLNEEGISLQDYLSLYNFLQNINDVDIALAVFNIAGASIDQATLKHVARTVAHVDLRDHLVDVLFTLFDENQDGQLSNREFVAVMKERLRRGLTKPKDTGFLKLLHAIWNSLKFDF